MLETINAAFSQVVTATGSKALVTITVAMSVLSFLAAILSAVVTAKAKRAVAEAQRSILTKKGQLPPSPDIEDPEGQARVPNLVDDDDDDDEGDR